MFDRPGGIDAAEHGPSRSRYRDHPQVLVANPNPKPRLSGKVRAVSHLDGLLRRSGIEVGLQFCLSEQGTAGRRAGDGKSFGNDELSDHDI